MCLCLKEIRQCVALCTARSDLVYMAFVFYEEPVSYDTCIVHNIIHCRERYVFEYTRSRVSVSLSLSFLAHGSRHACISRGPLINSVTRDAGFFSVAPSVL